MEVKDKTAEQINAVKINLAQLNNALKQGIEKVVSFIQNAHGGVIGGRNILRYGGCILGSDLKHANLVEVDKKAQKYALVFSPNVPISKDYQFFERLGKYPQNRKTRQLVFHFNLRRPAAGKLEDFGEGEMAVTTRDIGGRWLGDIYLSYKANDLIKLTSTLITADPKKEFNQNYNITTIHIIGDPFGKDLKVAVPKNIPR